MAEIDEGSVIGNYRVIRLNPIYAFMFYDS